MTTYFTSDLHFYHKNICKFTRRHEVVQQEHHEEWLIDIWNSTCTKADKVWHLGDFTFLTKYEEIAALVKKLPGQKFFIKGNHDRTKVLDALKKDGLIQNWYHYEEIKVGDWVKLGYWKDFFEVNDITEDEITLKTDNGQYYSSYYKRENWIIKEKEQQLKIEMNKKYRRVGTHEPVRVICVDRVTSLDYIPVLALLKHKDGIEESLYLTATGCAMDGKQIIEEIPAVDWSKVKVDTPMWMRTFGEGTWHKRHFHKFEGGRVHYWPNGWTSFTCNGTSDINSDKPENCSLEEPK